jgi:acylphosphatase
MRTVRLRVSGRVQGVGYRAFVIETAARLGLAGWVRNRRDGTVEALASGDAAAIAELIAACRRGPLTAHVGAVTIDDEGDDGSIGFNVRPIL